MVSFAFPQKQNVFGTKKRSYYAKPINQVQKKKDKLGFRLYDAPSDLHRQRAVKSQFGQKLVQETG